jgi:hypothetical protein
MALEKGKVRCLQFLLNHPDVDVNCMGKSEMRKEVVNAIMFCLGKEVNKETEDILNILMEHPRLDINRAPSHTGESPIHRAVLLENQDHARGFTGGRNIAGNV